MTKDPIRVDPEAVSRESGGTDEIIEASQKIVEGLSNCGRLEADKRYRIQLAHIVNTTGLRDYDEEIFYNHLLGQMIEASGDRFSFLDRQAVLNERREQVQGTVESQGVGKLKGADLVLTLEIRGLRGGQTRTVQYTAKLIDLAGEVMCLPRPVEIKKRD